MTLLADEHARERCLRHEGRRVRNGRHVAYQDHLGHWTIGFGHLCRKNEFPDGLSEAEAEWLFRHDWQSCRQAVFRLMDANDVILKPEGHPASVRFGVLTEMAFQLGAGGLKKFRRMWRALSKDDYPAAAAEMLDSKWRKDTPNRCETLAAIMRAGVDSGK